MVVLDSHSTQLASPFDLFHRSGCGEADYDPHKQQSWEVDWGQGVLLSKNIFII